MFKNYLKGRTTVKRARVEITKDSSMCRGEKAVGNIKVEAIIVRFYVTEKSKRFYFKYRKSDQMAAQSE